MSSTPYIAVLDGPDVHVVITALRSAAEIRDISEETYVNCEYDQELARLALTDWSSDRSYAQFYLVFEDLCAANDWHVVLDWDDLDDTTDFPYESLSRPAGAKEPVLLWPDD